MAREEQVTVLTKTGNSRTIPYSIIEFWDRIVMRDFRDISTAHSVWEENIDLLANQGTGKREGNLVTDFSRVLGARLLTRELNIELKPLSRERDSNSENATIVAQAVSDSLGLRSTAKLVVKDAMACGFGCFEVRHQQDPTNADIWHSSRSPALETPSPAVADGFVEVDPMELEQFGIEADSISPYTNEQIDPPAGPTGQVFAPTLGYPYIERVDPRTIIMPPGTKDPKRAPYIARLHFMTKAELEIVQDCRLPESTALAADTASLFESVEGESKDDYPDLVTVVELWIRRDRNNPSYNNWYFMYIMRDPKVVIRSERNAHGSYLPLEFLKLDPSRIMYSDITMVSELKPYSTMYAAGIRAGVHQMEKNLADKTLVGANAFTDEKEEAKLNQKGYSGTVKCNDVNAVRPFHEAGFPMDLIRYLTWVKSVAQMRTSTSDLDQGQAIKNITATQTTALLDATGINVEEIKEQLTVALKNVIIKMMFMISQYTIGNEDMRFEFKGKVADISRNDHDFTTSYTYDVAVNDQGRAYTDEERLMWMQFLKVLMGDQAGLLLPFIDNAEIARSTILRFGESIDLIDKKAVAQYRESKDQPQIPPDMQMGLDGGQQGVVNNVQGEHPERGLGSRGVDMGNALRGQRVTGSGMGEG